MRITCACYARNMTDVRQTYNLTDCFQIVTECKIARFNAEKPTAESFISIYCHLQIYVAILA